MRDRKHAEHGRHHKIKLMICDLLLLLLVDVLMLVIYPSEDFHLPTQAIVLQMLIGVISVYVWRIAGGVYRQIWRYGGTLAYLQMILLDFFAGMSHYSIQSLFIAQDYRISFVRVLSISALNLLLGLTIRFIYQYLYEYEGNRAVRLLRRLTVRLTDIEAPKRRNTEAAHGTPKINIAVVGAGHVGVMLAEELANNPRSAYKPCCFIDIDREKIGRTINGIMVLSEDEATQERLLSFPVQEIVFALPKMPAERKKQLYDQYLKMGCKIKVYDYPLTQTIENNGKRSLREFDIEELLFRQPLDFNHEDTRAYYRGKTVLISGGGGSIGSELCRQIAQMQPRRLVILDVYENGAYDIQQELRIAYGGALDVQVEIVSVCDRDALDRVFDRQRPDIVLHAAAHKHVPLMEKNCCEAVKNNVFGTLNIVDISQKYGVSKFTMISTDKAVNPTNVMGATKRMCEMIVLSRAGGKTNFSATRFGNVLGSNGSVIPLFRRQIANGGPVTLTDFRIIRYFMTIPEASQLVLESGAMASSGELYVLDMGKPVKILDLAENMIRLSGFEPYKDIDIVETGLRPGEKLYEELLIRSEELDKTDNHMIFVERGKPLSAAEVEEKLDVLREAVQTEDDETVREALKRVVPTFHNPDEVNSAAVKAKEMLQVDEKHAG